MAHSHPCPWFVARWAALFAVLAGFAGSVFAEEADRVFFVERMAVDTLEEDASGKRNFYESRMRPLMIQPAVLPMSQLRDARMAPVRSDADRARARELMERAQQRIAAGEYSLALIELRDALALEPDNLFALQSVSIIAMMLRDYVRAETFAARYLEAQPQDAQIWAVRAGALLRMARLDAAQVSLERVFELDPVNVSARFHEALLLMIREAPVRDAGFWRRQRLEDLLRVANDLVGEREELTALLGESDYARLTDLILGPGTAGQLEDLRDLIAKTLQVEPPQPLEERLALLNDLMERGVVAYGCLILKAEWLMGLGRQAEAREVWKALKAQFGDFPDALLNYGHFHFRLRELAAAIPALREARRLLAGQQPTVVDFVLACALAQNGDLNPAQEIFNSLALGMPRQVRQWLDSDVLFQDALRRLPNYRNILRLLDIPPESE